MGVSPDSRRNERLLIEAPSLQLQFSIPASSAEDAPCLNGEKGKLPRRWVEEHLHLPPMGGDVSGLGIYVSRLPPHLKEWAEAWDGVAVQARGIAPSSLAKEQRALLTSDPEASFIPHEEGRVFLLSPRHRSSPEFETPPRPQLGEQLAETELPDSRQRPTSKEIIDVYHAWHCQQGTHTEGVALTASALDVSEDEVQKALLKCPPPLPSVGPPPEADPFGSQQTRPAGNPFLQRSQAATPANTGLIQALGDHKHTNPLLQGSQVILSQPVNQGESSGSGRGFPCLLTLPHN